MNQIICFLVFVLLSIVLYNREKSGFANSTVACLDEDTCQVEPKMIDGKPVIELKFKLENIRQLKELRLIFSNPDPNTTFDTTSDTPKIYKVVPIKKRELQKLEGEGETYTHTYKVTENIFKKKKYDLKIYKYNKAKDSQLLQKDKFEIVQLVQDNDPTHAAAGSLKERIFNLLGVGKNSEKFSNDDSVNIDFNIKKKGNDHVISIDKIYDDNDDDQPNYIYSVIFFVNNDGPYMELIKPESDDVTVENRHYNKTLKYLISNMIYKFTVIGIPYKENNTIDEDYPTIFTNIKEIKIEQNGEVKEKKIDQFYSYVCCKANGQHTIISNCENCNDGGYFAKTGLDPFDEERHKEIMSVLKTDQLDVKLNTTEAPPIERYNNHLNDETLYILDFYEILEKHYLRNERKLFKRYLRKNNFK